MMDAEKLIFKLSQDVAVLAETQKSFQRYQSQTTDNVNKLTDVVDRMAKEAIRLESIFSDLSSLEKRMDTVVYNMDRRIAKLENNYMLWSKTVIGTIFVGAIGLIFKYTGA